LTIIDWFTTSYIADAKEHIPLPIVAGFALGEEEPTKGGKYHTQQRVYPAGTLYHKYTENYHALLNFTGSELAQIRQHEGLEQGLLDYAAEYATNVTRIDFATDTTHKSPYRAWAWIEEMLHHFRTDKAKTRIRTAPKIYDDLLGGFTQYFGSRGGDKYVRVYDKGALTEEYEQTWVRIELQARKKHANPIWEDVKKFGVVKAGRYHTKKVVDFPELDWWCEALEGEAFQHTQVPMNVGKWEQWLGTQVLPSIQKHWHANQGTERATIKKVILELSTLLEETNQG
jgi:hypothetical protein